MQVRLAYLQQLPIASATAPPTPVSTSSNIKVFELIFLCSAIKETLIASIILDNSPPEAILEIKSKPESLFVSILKITLSIPFGCRIYPCQQS